MEEYLSPAQEISLYCTTDERQGFEQFCKITLQTDVCSQHEFERLFGFLSEHYKLVVT